MSVSLQCEPSYFDAVKAEGDEHVAVVALDGGQVVGVGGLSARPRYYNGRPARVGYLGHLRLAVSHAGRADVVRRGYGLLGEACRSLGVDVCFTSVAADNERARQLLERGARRLPRYASAGELATALVRPRRSPTSAPENVSRWDHLAPQFQLAPQPSAEPAGLWVQWRSRQTVVTRYSARLAAARPACNAVGRLLGRGVPLPPVGTPLRVAFAMRRFGPVDSIDPLLGVARPLGASCVAVAFDVRDPRLADVVRRFRPFVFRTRLYTVQWPDQPPIDPPDGRLQGPEVATL